MGEFRRPFWSVFIIFLGVLASGLFAACGRDGNASAMGDVEVGDSAIIGGEQVSDARRLEYERAVLGLELLNENGIAVSWCTSVLIRPDVILTAGHCFDSNFIPDLKSVRVQATTNLKTVSPENPAARRIVTHVLHPEFDSHAEVVGGVRYFRHDHDLALGFLDRPMDASIVPQRLVSANQPLRAGDKVTIFGFGKAVDYNEISSSEIAKRFLTLQRGLLTLAAEMLFDRRFTRSDSTVSNCQGDSGGHSALEEKSLRDGCNR